MPAMSSPKLIAARIKHYRRLRGLTQQALAVKAGVSLGWLGRLEVGLHDPRVSSLAKLAKALGISVNKLLE